MSYLANKKRILKIGRLELVLEKGGTDGRTDKTKSTKDMYLMSYLSNKKRILKIGRLNSFWRGGTDGQTDGHLGDVKTYFPFFNSFKLKKGKWAKN